MINSRSEHAALSQSIAALLAVLSRAEEDSNQTLNARVLAGQLARSAGSEPRGTSVQPGSGGPASENSLGHASEAAA